MTPRQRVVVLLLILLILIGNGVNLVLKRQQITYLSVADAAEPNALSAQVVTKAFNPDGTEHDLVQCDRVHINWATADELQQLPGIGKVLAQRIIAARNDKYFKELDDVLAVSGIGDKKLQQIAPLICLAIPDATE